MFSGFSTKRCFTQPRPEWRLMGHLGQSRYYRTKLWSKKWAGSHESETFSICLEQSNHWSDLQFSSVWGNTQRQQVTTWWEKQKDKWSLCVSKMSNVNLGLLPALSRRTCRKNTHVPTSGNTVCFQHLFCVQTLNLSNVLHEQDSQWFRFYPRMLCSYILNKLSFFLLKYKLREGLNGKKRFL